MFVIKIGFCLLTLLCALIFATHTMYAQAVAPDVYRIHLKDKGHCPTFAPHELLSMDGLARRLRHGVPLDESDYPVFTPYLEQIKQTGVKVYGTSKWLNAVYVTAEPSQIFALKNLTCIQSIQRVPIKAQAAQVNRIQKVQRTLSNDITRFQLQQIELEALHQKGYVGTNIKVAVFDTGFLNVDKIWAFQPLWQRNGVLGKFDFVTNSDTTLFTTDWHGLHVLSILAAYRPDTFHGAAYGANYYLLRSENVATETKIEEYYWVKAAEWADSVGADIINSSLGYSTFDNGEGNYDKYFDLDGSTGVVTLGAVMAARKGILVVTAAGNEGGGSWRKITLPCDADSILCVGAVRGNGERTFFSGVGPTTDLRIKPDVMARGETTALVAVDGSNSYGAGTSYAAPLIAGLAACLMQANPQANTQAIIHAIRMSANRATNPDTLYGYGVPNAEKADSILKATLSLVPKESNTTPQFCFLAQSPQTYFVRAPHFSPYTLKIFNLTGQLVYTSTEQYTNISYHLPAELSKNTTYVLQAEFTNAPPQPIIRCVLPVMQN